MSAEWEIVVPGDVIHKHLYRTSVSGGWIYKSAGDGMCFAPAPAPESLGIVHIMGKPKRPIIVDVDFTEVDKEEKAS